MFFAKIIDVEVNYKAYSEKSSYDCRVSRHKNLIIVTGYMALYHSDFWITAGLCPTVLQFYDSWIITHKFQCFCLNSKNNSGRYQNIYVVLNRVFIYICVCVNK